jgi:hypothetical protein
MHAAMTPKAEMRVLVGLVVQPFVAFAAASLAFPGPAALGAAVAAVFVVIVGALPAIAWLSRRGPITLGKALISGALLGNLPIVVILLLAALTDNLRVPESGGIGVLRMFRSAPFGAFVGMACAFVFWLIVRRAPDATA